MRVIKIKLDYHIKRLNVTQEEFSRMSGLRPATVSLLVNNKYDRLKLSHILTILNTIESEDFNELFEIIEE